MVTVAPLLSIQH